MKSLFITAIMICISCNLATQAESFLPQLDHDGQTTTTPTLKGAMGQFDKILTQADTGQLDAYRTNDDYNQNRIKTLKQEIAAKKAYQRKLPEIVQKQFATMMSKYDNLDPKQQEVIAQNIKSQWDESANTLAKEINILETQLATCQSRLVDSSVQVQMLEVNSAMKVSQNQIFNTQAVVNTQSQPTNAFANLTRMANMHKLNKIKQIMPLNIIPLHRKVTMAHMTTGE